MSTHRQARDAGRRTPVRRAVATRQSASGPGDRVCNARDVATYFREDCRTLRDSLQLEMVVAQYVLRMHEVTSPEGIPVGDAVSAGVVTALEDHGDPLAHAILRGLAYLGVGEASDRSADAVARLSECGVKLPGKFRDVTQSYASGAWRERGHDGEYAFFADFEFAHSPGHSLALFVEPRHGGVIKHIGLMPPISDLGPDDPFHPATMEALDIVDAGELLSKLLDRSYPRSILDFTDDYRVVIAAARARSMQRGVAAEAA